MKKTDKRLEFYVGKADHEDGYVAVSARAPHFCFCGKTEDEVVETTLRAWKFYLDFQGETSKPTISKQSSITTNRKVFVPEKHFYAVA